MRSLPVSLMVSWMLLPRSLPIGQGIELEPPDSPGRPMFKPRATSPDVLLLLSPALNNCLPQIPYPCDHEVFWDGFTCTLKTLGGKKNHIIYQKKVYFEQYCTQIIWFFFFFFPFVCFVCAWARVSYNLSSSRICNFTKAKSELLILMLPPLGCWDYRPCSTKFGSRNEFFLTVDLASGLLFECAVY